MFRGYQVSKYFVVVFVLGVLVLPLLYEFKKLSDSKTKINNTHSQSVFESRVADFLFAQKDVWAAGYYNLMAFWRSASCSTVLVYSGDLQGEAPGATLSAPFKVIAKDTSGNPCANITISWSVTLGGGSLSGQTFITDSNGLAEATLTLGGSGGINNVVATATSLSGTPTATFTAGAGDVLVVDGSGGSTLNGVAISTCGGTSTCDSTNPYVIATDSTYARVTLQNAGVITGVPWVYTSNPSNPAVGNGILKFTSYGPVTVCSTCKITMDGKGYTGGAPGTPGGYITGLSTWGNSAANGQSGGQNNGGAGGGHANVGSVVTGGSGGAVGGTADLSSLSLGGGGGGGWSSASAYGGNGGGAIQITAGAVINAGTISANGNTSASVTGNTGGGGAGGAIYLTSEVDMINTGTIIADKGDGGASLSGGTSGGSGSVGRIRVSIGSTTYPTVSLTGTIYPASYTTVPDNINLNSTISANYYGITTLKSLTASTSTQVSLPAVTITNNLDIASSSTLTARGTLTVNGNLTMSTGSTLTGPAWFFSGNPSNPSSTNGILEVVVSGSVSICATCVVTMEGKGFTGGAMGTPGTYITGLGSYGNSAANGQSGSQFNGGAGGGHASTGSAGPSGSPGGAAAGTADLSSMTIGGGGGGGFNFSTDIGGNGGGGIKITANSIQNSGTITSNGANGPTTGSQSGAGGGAGGSVYLIANTFSNTGSITATKGIGAVGSSTTGGNGSDGRIRISVGGSPSTLSILGTVYPAFYLVAPNNSDLTVTSGVNLYTTTALSSLSLSNGTSTIPGLTIAGSMDLTSTAVTVSGALTIGSNFTLTSGASLTGTGWVFAGNPTNPSVGNGVLQIDVTSALSVCATCVIHMDYKGFKGGTTPGYMGDSETALGTFGGWGPNGQSGGQNAGGAGGSHGTSGTASSGGGGPGNTGGNALLSPISIGGGGGAGYNVAANVGGYGGGAVKITAASITNQGTIRATGQTAPTVTQNAGGGGAGGAVHLTTTGYLNNTGTISALGGSGGSSTTGGNTGGNGGSGRIRLDYGTITRGTVTPTEGSCNGGAAGPCS